MPTVWRYKIFHIALGNKKYDTPALFHHNGILL